MTREIAFSNKALQQAERLALADFASNFSISLA
jgi:hypothetical protein